jgi:hypothetical protein
MVIGGVAAPRRNFTRVPNDVLDDDALPGPARWVFTLLSRLSPGVRLDEPTLMRKSGLCRNVLRRALRALEDAGLIARRQQRRGRDFGDVVVHVGDRPLPIDLPVADDPEKVNADDQGKQGVPAGHCVDPERVDASMYWQDYEPKDQGGGVRDVRAGARDPGTPTRHEGTSTMTKRNTPIPGQRSLMVQVVPPAPAPVDTTSSAGLIVKGWIDYAEQEGVKLPRRIIGHYAKVIGEAFADGFDPDLIKRTLAQMLADGVAGRPSWFPERLVSAQNPRRAAAPRGMVMRGGHLMKERTAVAFDLVAKMEALDAADEARALESA